MLVVRSSQLHALRHAAWKNFEDEMWDHWSAYFPVDCELMGERSARKAIRYGIERADAAGFTMKGEMCRYIDLSLSLGSDFDKDPLLPWAAEILAQTCPVEVKAKRMDMLHDRAMSHLREVVGADGASYRRAMTRARRVTYEQAALAGGVRPFETAVRAWLGTLYPQKFEALREATWKAFFAFGCDDADKYGMTNEAATLLHFTVMFMLGSHYARDPQVAWASEVLRNTALVDPEAKARALVARVMMQLDKVFALLRAKGG